MRLSRRDVIQTAVNGIALRAAGAAQSRQEASKKPGHQATSIGQRSTFEQPRRLSLFPTNSRTPLQDLQGTITPADLHFERHHSGVPEMDPREYSLLVHGMVDRPTIFTLADLKRLPSVTRICFLECSGNLTASPTATTTPQDLCGLTSQSEWVGVAVSTLLREVGAKPKATWFLAEGADAALLSRSVPVDKGYDDALIAYGQNGEGLRPEQGYPARLLLPGWEGNMSVKWIRRIELADRPFMTREETSKYTDPLANDTARIFSFVMDARSVITSPCPPMRLARGWLEVRGLAWSGYGKIRRVDISLDNGRNWTPAKLHGPVLSKAHTRFSLPFNWTGEPVTLLSRAVDETGYVQPSWSELVATRGPRGNVTYHRNPITGWRIDPDGAVSLRPEAWE